MLFYRVLSRCRAAARGLARGPVRAVVLALGVLVPMVQGTAFERIDPAGAAVPASSGAQAPALDPRSLRAVPVFAGDTAAVREILENTGPDVSVGAPVVATIEDEDEVLYALQGTHGGRFAIGPYSGQITTLAAGYDHETTPVLSFEVLALGLVTEATFAIEVRVTDVAEPPGAPALPVVYATGPRHLDVSWTEPANTGPPVSGYAVRWREAGSTGAWSLLEFAAAARNARVAGLDNDTAYQVVVCASNDEGDGPCSAAARARTDPALVPVWTHADDAPGVAVSTVGVNTIVRLTFSGAAAANGLTEDEVTVSGGTLISFAPHPDGGWQLALIATLHGAPLTVSVAADVVDEGNLASARVFIPDLRGPVFSVTWPAGPVSGPVSVPLSSDEPVRLAGGGRWFRPTSDLAVVNALVAGATDESPGSAWTVQLVPTTGIEGEIVLSVPANFAEDEWGNANGAWRSAHALDTDPLVVDAITVGPDPADGYAFRTGAVIEVAVLFADSGAGPATAMAAAPDARIAIEVGETTRAAGYLRGGGSDTLVFGYTVLEADVDEDGISLPVNPLSGILLDVDGGPVDAAHPGVSTPHRVNAHPGLRLLAATTPGASGWYAIGDVLRVVAWFATDVEVTGTPVVVLETGPGPLEVPYARGTGGASLVFETVLEAGPDRPGGYSHGTGAIELRGGTVRYSAFDYDAVLVHPSAAHPEQRIDATRPLVVSARSSLDGRSVVIGFNEALGPSAVSAGRFGIVKPDGTSIPWINASESIDVDRAGRTVTVRPGTGLVHGTVYTLAYHDLDGDNTEQVVEDEAGNDLASFASFAVENLVVLEGEVPDAPVGLGVTPADAALALAWTAGGDGGQSITGHQYRIRAVGGAWPLQWSAAGEGVQLVEGLQNGTAYEVEVRAVNLVGPGPAASVSGTPRTVPEAPGDLVASLVLGRSVVLGWTVPDDGGAAIDAYVVERAAAVDGPWESIRIPVTGPLSSYVDSGLDAGTDYWYRLHAVNVAGAGPVTAVVAVRTGVWVNSPVDGTAVLLGEPTVRETLSVDTSALSDLDGPFDLGAVVAYQWERVSTGGARTVLAGETGSSYTVSHRDIGSVLQAVVRYTDDHGTDEETIAGPTALVAAAVPLAVARTIPFAYGVGRILVRWNPPSHDGGSPVTGYTLESARAETGPWSVVVADHPTRSYIDGVEVAVRIYYRVAAINAMGASAWSGIDSTIAPDVSNYAGQGALHLSGSAYVGGTVVVDPQYIVEPDGPDDPAELQARFSYQWYRQLIGGPRISIPGATQLSYTIQRADAGYYVAVSGQYVDDAGNTERFETYLGVIARVSPGVPREFAATAPSYSTVLVSWTAPRDDGGSPVTGYVLQTSSDAVSGPWDTLAVDAGALSHLHAGLAGETRHWYRVRARNAQGAGGWTDAVSATTPAQVNRPPTGAPGFIGEALIGGVLVIDASGIEDPDGPADLSTVIAYVWLRVLADGTHVVVGTNPAYVVTEADAGRVLRGSVAYVDALGTSEVLFTPDAGPVPAIAPGAPASFAVSVPPGSTSRIELSWAVPERDGGSAVTGYDVEWAASPGGPWSVAATALQARSWTDTGLGEQTTRHYRVAARNEVGRGPFTEPGSGRTGSDTPGAGAPALVGAPLVGSALVADVSGLVDPNGLPGAEAMSYEWIASARADLGDSRVLAGSASEHVLTELEAELYVAVRVSYVDLEGVSEGPFASAAVGPVEPAVFFVEASAPPQVFGLDPYPVRVDSGLGLASFPASALTVVGAEVAGAPAASDPRTWTVSVEPSGTGTVTLSVAQGALSTEFGSKNEPLDAVSTVVYPQIAATLLVVPTTLVEGGAAAVVSVELDRAPERELSIPLVLTPLGGAQAGDYALGESALAFAADVRRAQTSLAAVADDLEESGESVRIDLGTLGDGMSSASGAIEVTLRDPAALPVATVADAAADEGAPVTFTVSLSAPAPGPVSIGWEMNIAPLDTASGADLAAASGTVTIALGGHSGMFAVPTLEDERDEPDERFTVVLVSVSGALLADDAAAFGTIRDDDPEPEASLAPAQAAEGDPVRFEIVLSAASARTVHVGWGAAVGAGDTAAVGLDFVAVAGAVAAFAPGVTRAALEVVTVEDALDEPDETFTVTLTALANVVLGSDASARGTVVDDDAQPTLSVRDGTGPEGGAIGFELVLSAATGRHVSVDWALGIESGDDASPGDFDPTVPAGGTFVFEAGGALTRRVEIVSVDDALDEADERFSVEFGNLRHAAFPADARYVRVRGTIVDDDPVPVVSAAAVTIGEGDAGAVEVSLSAPSGREVRVAVATALTSGTAAAAAGDFLAVPSTTLVFAPGEQRKRVTVSSVQDTVDEVDERFSLVLSEPVHASLASTAFALVTIRDDDGAPVARVADASAVEGGPITFTVTLAGQSAREVWVGWSTAPASDDTATPDVDFSTNSGRVTFPAGAASATFDVATVSDTVSEHDETFTVILIELSGVTLAAEPTARGRIVDDDPLPSVRIGDAGAVESGAVGFEAVLSVASGRTVTVGWRASVEAGDTAGADDFAAVSGTLTFAAGGVRQAFEIATVVDDALDEDDETFTVTLVDPVNAVLAEPGAVAVATIVDDDPLPSVRLEDGNGLESGVIGLEAVLSAASGRTVTVGWSTSIAAGDTAGADDLAAASGTLTFAAGELRRTVEVDTVVDDALDEDEETFTVSLAGPVNAVLADPGATATASIVDDDSLPSLRIEDANGLESGAIGLEAVLSLASERIVTVGWSTSIEAGDTAGADDFAAVSGTLTFAVGEVRRAFEVATVVDDALDEDDETFTVTLGAAVNAVVAGSGASATATIVDDDPLPFVLTADRIVVEGESVAFGIRLSVVSGREVRVGWTVALGEVDTASAADVVLVQDVGVAIPAGESGVDVVVETIEDPEVETIETFRVELSSPVNAGLDPGAWHARGFIYDDDEAPVARVVSFDKSRFMVAEEHGGLGRHAMMTLTVDPAPDAELAIPLRWTLVDGMSMGDVEVSVTSEEAYHADLPEDGADPVSRWVALDLEDPEVVFAAGEGSRMLRVRPMDDAEVEGTETLVISFGEPLPVGVEAGENPTATVVIRNMDGLAVRFANGPYMSHRHTGPADRPQVVVAFSEAVADFGPGSGSLQVEGARVLSVQPLGVQDGTPEHAWILRFVPDGEAPVSVALVSMVSCSGEPPGICTPDDRVVGAMPMNPWVLPYEAPDDPSPETDDETPPVLTEDARTVLTGRFVRVPRDHAGRGSVDVHVAFSEGVAVAADAFAASGIKVRGGRAVRALALDEAHARWKLTLRPARHADLRIVIPAAPDCARAGAVCTVDGRGLARPVSARIRGLPALRIADARVREAPRAVLRFVVRLQRASPRPVRVSYRTVDGTARAGEDYKARHGRLDFAPGEIAKKIVVPVIDDLRDEGEETMRVRLGQVVGAVLADPVATGTIFNSDPMPRAWLGRFARTVADGVAEAVRRESADRGAGQLTVGGQRVTFAPGRAPPSRRRGAVDDALEFPGPAIPDRTPGAYEFLRRSSFELRPGAGEGPVSGPGWTLWGAGALARFSGRDDAVAVDGRVGTALLGTHLRRGRWVTGVALAWSEGAGGFRAVAAGPGGPEPGAVRSRLASAHPYVRVALGERVDLWGVGGYGTGTVRVNDLEAATRFSMAAGGADVGLVVPATGDALSVRARAEARLAGIESRAVETPRGRLASASARTARVRVLLETRRAFTVGAGARLEPVVALGLRSDSGDMETGSGVEVETRVGYARPGSRVRLAGHANVLLAHRDAEYREWSVGGALRLAPRASREGLSFTLAPDWGAGGATRPSTWRLARDGVLAPAAPGGAGVEAELGYGVRGPGRVGVLTPYARLAARDAGARTWTAGVRWSVGTHGVIDVATVRDESAQLDAPRHSVRVNASLRW